MKQKIFVIVVTVFTICINLLANIVRFNNKSTAEISDSFAVYFVPAGYVFAIWGLIYLAILGYSLYQFKYSKAEENGVISEINEWYLISCLANSIWIFLWHYEFIVATIFMMILLLISLLNIYLELKKVVKFNKKFLWMVKLPFSLYLGWISVATIANMSDVLFALGFTGGDNAANYAAIMILVAAVLAVIMLLREKDYMYAAVIVWALIGIAVKFSVVPVLTTAVSLAVFTIVVSSIIAKVNQYNKKG